MQDFAIFILTYGRPDNVLTLKTLENCGYKGPIYLITSSDDKKLDIYKEKFGEIVVTFDKADIEGTFDKGNNFDEKRAVVYARNATFGIAKDLGVKYFLMLDDDYTTFMFRFENKLGYTPVIKDLNRTIEIFLNFFKSTNIKSIAFSQGGDHIGGFSETKMLRKCMNSFFCAADRPFEFMGDINEDVNAYAVLGHRGDIFFTFTSVQLCQKQTQKQNAGLTDIYLKFGTYYKSFLTVMMHPSGAKVSMLNSTHQRIHHAIKWDNTTPKIISQTFKK